MAKPRKKTIFEILLNNGQKVEVTYEKDFMNHMEFRGPVSETGYYSDFPHPDPGPNWTREEYHAYARRRAQELYDKNPVKYGIQKPLMVG